MSKRQEQMHVEAPAQEVPVLYDVDVVVAGAGIAGSIAAIAAGRQGARTLVIDRFGQLGGNIGPGMFGGGSLHLALSRNEAGADDEQLINVMGMGGIPEEFHRRVIFARPNADQMTDAIRKELEDRHFNVPEYRMGAGAGLPGYLVDSYTCSHVLLAMMQEAGVEMLLSAYVGDPIMEGNRVAGLFVETKSGRVAVKAKVVVDGTSEADVCFRAGAPVATVGNPNLGTYYVLKNVDIDRYRQWADARPDPDDEDLRWSRQHLTMEESEADPMPHLHHMLPQVRQAWETGEFEIVRRVGDCEITITRKDNRLWDGMMGGRTGTRGTVDFSDARMVTVMEREHREQIVKYARFLRKYIPGFENCYLLLIAPYLNARGGRYLDSVYPVSGDDVSAGRTFDDVIYRFHCGRAQNTTDIPYRTLVPKRIDGLLACGTSSMRYGPNFRVRYSMLLNGQAAGIAAGMCALDNVQPRDLEVRRLQRALVALNCPLGDDARRRELGLID